MFWSVNINKNHSLVCVLQVCIVAFTILLCIIQKPFIGGILNWKLKPENKPEVKLLHSYDCLYSFLLLKFSRDFFFFYVFAYPHNQWHVWYPTRKLELLPQPLLSWEALI